MRTRFLLAILAVVLAAFSGPATGRADETTALKPVAMVSVAGYDRIMDDLELVGQISERPHLRDGLEGMLMLFTQGKGLDGLDKSRPWGFWAATDGKEVGGCAFIPVTDLDKLMTFAGQYGKGKITKLDDGIYEITAPHKTIYVQETHKGWAYIVKNKDHFAHVPSDPLKTLDGLNNRYDLAVQIYPKNLPEECRAKLLDRIDKKLQKMAKRHKAKHKHAHHHKWNAEKAEQVQKHLNRVFGDLEQLTVGLSLDNDLHQGIVELSATAVEGSKAAEHFNQLATMQTQFGGFELRNAAVTARVTSQCAAPSADHLDAMIDHMRKAAYKKIERKDKDGKHAEAARKIVDIFLDVAKKTAASGRHDGAVSIALDEHASTLIAGRRVVDAPKLEKAVKLAIAELTKDHADFIEKTVTLDADEYLGVKMHIASLPIPDRCKAKDRATKAVGEKLEIVLGLGPEAVYVAAGRDALTSLKRAINESQLAAQWTVPPLMCTIDLGELAEFVEDVGPPKCRAMADKIDDLLEASRGLDQVRLIVVPGERTIRFRVELDEGVLRVIHKIKPPHKPRKHKKHGGKI